MFFANQVRACEDRCLEICCDKCLKRRVFGHGEVDTGREWRVCTIDLRDGEAGVYIFVGVID